jgi:O-acetyl-ADP-ribose deacetylase (regulator of RNase III)
VIDFKRHSNRSWSKERLLGLPIGSIKLVLGDITTLAVEAIVNAANTSLLAGGGVCGAIHMAAGPRLEDECFKLGGCPTGEARITKGYDLPAKYVIHTVGPKYSDGARNQARLLRNCYKAIFKIVKDNDISSVAIPAIATGIFGFPLEQATAIAIEEAKMAIKLQSVSVVFCCFDKQTLDAYNMELQKNA